MLGQGKMSSLILPLKDKVADEKYARGFCFKFVNGGNIPKYVLGRNVYAESVIKHVEINGIVDDFTDQTTYLNLPIVRSEDIEKSALVLVVAGGRPQTARRRIRELGIEHLDYFSFLQHSDLPLVPIVFNEGFAEDFADNESEYEWVYNQLVDAESKESFRKLVSFRCNNNLEFLEGFTSREKEQYFEDFLQLKASNESFIDVGGYDGFTSLEFIKRCPKFEAIHLFEPDPENFKFCRQNLSHYDAVFCHQAGLSNKRSKLRFSQQGSASVISDQGSVLVDVIVLDELLDESFDPTFIKMDIEGAELSALEGMRHIIQRCKPRLAISVYHKAGDFWRIPKFILGVRSDYDLYLRHYTESIYETVMFFIPRA